MAETLYGGILYPNSSFHIDKIYENYSLAQASAATDTILVGRYVLIAYTERPLSYSRREVIKSQYYTKNNLSMEEAEIASTNISNILDLTIEEIKYRDNYVLDGYIDYDRILCRKAYKNNTFVYEPIANLSTSIDLASGYKVDENNKPIQATDEEGNLLYWDDAKTLPRYELTDNNFLQAFDDIVWAFDHLDDQLDADVIEVRRLEGVLGNPETGLIKQATDVNNSLTVSTFVAQEQKTALNTTIETAEHWDEKLKATLDADVKPAEEALQSLVNLANGKTTDDLNIKIDQANDMCEVLETKTQTANTLYENLNRTYENANSFYTETMSPTFELSKDLYFALLEDINKLEDNEENEYNGLLKQTNELTSNLEKTITDANQEYTKLSDIIVDAQSEHDQLFGITKEAEGLREQLTVKNQEVNQTIQSATNINKELSVSSNEVNKLIQELNDPENGLIQQAEKASNELTEATAETEIITTNLLKNNAMAEETNNKLEQTINSGTALLFEWVAF